MSQITHRLLKLLIGQLRRRNQLFLTFQILEQHCKFITAETGNQRIGSKTILETLTQNKQQMISRQMSQRVINMPEIIQVNQHTAKFLDVVFGLEQDLFESAIEGITII